jgi:RNA polymerase sigma-70 factor (ECF subfamily)
MKLPHENKSHDWLAEHGDYLYRYALARLRDPHLAEDAVQETLLAALQGSGFAGNSSPRTWLTGILKHKIIDQFRRQQRETGLEEPDDIADDDPGMDEFFLENGHWSEPPQSWGDPGSLLQQEQFLMVLQECMDRLPKKLARIFMLREVEETDNEEICKELEISPTNAWVMLYRARMGLRKCIEMNWLEAKSC